MPPTRRTGSRLGGQPCSYGEAKDKPHIRIFWATVQLWRLLGREGISHHLSCQAGARQSLSGELWIQLQATQGQQRGQG